MTDGADLDVDERIRSSLATVPRGTPPVPGSWSTIEERARGLRAHRARRQRLAWAACLVLVPLVVVSLATVTTIRPAGPFGPSDRGLVTFGGTRTGYGPDGDRTLVVTFTGGSPDLTPDDPCWTGYRVEADMAPAAVDVALRQEGPSWFTRFRNRGVGCTMAGFARVVTSVLPAPIDGRPLIDRATGRPVAVFDGSTLLRPTGLSPGWAQHGESGAETGEGPLWSRTFADADPTPRTVSAPRMPAPRSVTITQEPPTRSPVADGAIVSDRPVVRGTTAEYIDRIVTRTLTWVEDGQRVSLTTSAYSGAQPLDEAELVAFAESLVPEG